VTWYVTDLARFQSERAGLDTLADASDWFITIGWRIDDKIRLVLDAEIIAGGRTYPIFLQYPDLYPYTPPSVFPRAETSRWSQHQFGAGGELCLEYGPDNWVPELTGAQMIESAHRLLEAENPQTGEREIVLSRHLTTLGQRLRGRFSRMLLTRATEELFASVPVGVPLIGNIVLGRHEETFVNVLNKITRQDGSLWVDQNVPKQLGEEWPERAVVIYRIDAMSRLPITGDLEEFRTACIALGLTPEGAYVVLLQGQTVHPVLLWEQENRVIPIAVIPAETEEVRLSLSHELLKEKQIALVGCGSLGSKLGAMLARSGVGRFVLVDDDMLLPDNLVRNDLDWRDVGTHKAVALARRMQLVNPHVETRIRRSRLAGQESGDSAETALNMVVECDLIFDATANPDILNLISAIAASTHKTVMWAEVFGGGIGGLIARCRHGIEPSPQHMRWAIENWFAEQGSSPPVRERRRYETDRDGAPLIADDADVSVIAAHAARFAIDTLIQREPSSFPNSVYAIGLAAGLVFTQPFETYPIGVGPCPLALPVEELSPKDAATQVAKIIELFKARVNEASATPEDDRPSQA